MKPVNRSFSSPFQNLLVLAERVRQSGSNLPDENDSINHWAGINCRIFNKDYTLKLNDVAEIVDIAPISIIPGSANWVKGVINLRGRLLPIFGVDEYFGKSANISTVGKIIVVEKETIFCGIIAEKVYGMKKYLKEDFVNNRDKNSNSLNQYVDYIAKDETEKFSVLNIVKLAKLMTHLDPVLNAIQH